MTDEQFYEFCRLNDELRIERTADHYILVLAPTSAEIGHFNFELSVEIGLWNRQTGLGYGFDSSSGFKLPTGSERSPDAAWIRRDRWEALSAAQRRRFAPIAPDFVAEIRSGDQSLDVLQEKMAEYLDAGCRLGWLIDPKARQTTVYRPGSETQHVPFDQALSGEAVMPGFEVVLSRLW